MVFEIGCCVAGADTNVDDDDDDGDDDDDDDEEAPPGRVAAVLAVEGRWDSSVPREACRVVYCDKPC